MYPGIKLLTKEEVNKLKKEYSYKHKWHPAREHCYSSRKKIQRDLNYHVAACNKSIKEDWLWRGRFFVRQVNSPQYDAFEDGSGGELYVTLRFYDKKTMKYMDVFDSAGRFMRGIHCVHWLMNKFMVEVIKVMQFDRENPEHPYNDCYDYNSVPEEYVQKHAEPVSSVHNYFS